MAHLIGISRVCEKGAAPAELAAADIRFADGIADDVRGHSPRRQVTVLFRDGWEAACRTLGIDLAWTLRRANLYIDGMSAPRIGSHISIGGAVLAVRLETEPCHKMDRAHAGLRAALKPNWRGGVCCSVIAPGPIRLGDPVAIL